MIDKKQNMLYNINVLVIWGVVLIMEIKNVLLMVLVTFVFVALFIPVVKKIAEFIGAMDNRMLERYIKFLFLD